ncbi:sugar phosphate isomerase/epimerase family protein [Halarchaeum salinum]|uniref:Xylose isomerase-like TIM barrel domain-containing protein n=1 Tax=Halarchaeum salinum TaxID=489912 RepID=A0AAV3SAK0_9EURY
MQVAGKARPTDESLRAAADRGFDAVELYVTPDLLDTDSGTLVERVRASPVTACSVHTPHVLPSATGPLRAADRIASALEAYLVVHTQYANMTHTPVLAEAGFAAAHGYENQAGASVRHVEAQVLRRGHELVLDTAHLYLAHADYQARFRTLLDEHGERIEVVHLADATRETDGLGFGEGEMAMDALARTLKARFDGTVVLEVMPAEQADALARFRTA